MAQKFAMLFVEESGDSIKEYVISDLIIPAIKDSIIGAIEMLLYGTARSRSSKHGTSSSGYTPYNKYAASSPTRSSAVQTKSQGSYNINQYRDITYDTRAEAEDVYHTLLDLVNDSDYHQATIADFFDASEISIDNNYIFDDWGWKELPEKYPVRHAPGGRFYLDMPPHVSLV